MLKLLLSSILFIALAAQPCFAQSGEHATRVKEHRTEQHQHFLDAEQSPLTGHDRAHFKGLPYFPIDSTYSVEARFKRTKKEEPFKMNTSSGKQKDFVKYGEASFELMGEKLTLNLYQNLAYADHPEYGKQLFVPFTDPTNGNESYGGGRYMDILIPEGKTFTIDFNLAYNPYCAYSSGWSCPIPPRENDLSVPIKAGVKQWKHDHNHH